MMETMIPPQVGMRLWKKKKEAIKKEMAQIKNKILYQLHDHAKQYDNDGACHNKRNGGNCMAIYLGMSMEMP